jgi:hypothetical protein
MILGGTLALLVSILLLVSVMSRPRVGLNWVNGFTIFLAGLGGVLALRWPNLSFFAAPLIIVAALPALAGGVGLLYVPAVVCLAAAPLVDSGKPRRVRFIRAS